MEAVEKIGGLWCVRLQSPSTPVACREATKLLLVSWKYQVSTGVWQYPPAAPLPGSIDTTFQTMTDVTDVCMYIQGDGGIICTCLMLIFHCHHKLKFLNRRRIVFQQ